MKKKETRAGEKKKYLAHQITKKYQPPSDVDEQNKLADELIVWAKNPETITIESFPISKNISPSLFYKCSEVNKYFEAALDLAMYTIGNRLLSLWYNKKIEKDFCLRLLPLYNKEYKQLSLEKTYQDAKGKASGSVVNVIYDKYPETESVPSMKEHREFINRK